MSWPFLLFVLIALAIAAVDLATDPAQGADRVDEQTRPHARADNDNTNGAVK